MISGGGQECVDSGLYLKLTFAKPKICRTEGVRMSETNEDGLGLERDAESFLDPRLHQIFESDDLGRGRSAEIDECERVIIRDAGASQTKTLLEAGVFDKPGSRYLDRGFGRGKRRNGDVDLSNGV